MPQKDQISNNEWFAQSNADFKSPTLVFNFVSKFEVLFMIVKSFTIYSFNEF